MTSKRKILLFQPDSYLRKLLTEQLLRSPDLEIQSAENLAAAVDALSEVQMDLVIMDAGSGDAQIQNAVQEEEFSGLTIRDHYANLPMILLIDNVESKKKWPKSQNILVDFVVKPFRFHFLLGRIRVLLHQFDQHAQASMAIGPYQFNPTKKVLQLDEALLRLTDKEVAILRYLAGRAPKTVSREELLEKVWGYNSGVTTHTLETHIYRLRQKIESDRFNKKIILTDMGGYKLENAWNH